MWTPETADYRKDVGSTLLLSAWHELFHGYTPDSFQPRLHNVSSLIDELVDIAVYWQVDERFSTHIKKIQDELAATIKSESAILSKIPAYRSRAVALSHARTPQTIVSGGEILAGLREQYWRAFEKLAVQSMRELPRNKKAAMLNLRRLATFAFRQGKEDDDVWDPLDKDASASPETTFSRLAELAREPSRSYACTLTILGDITGLDSAIRKCGHQQAATRTLPEDFKRDLGYPTEKQLHVRVEVEASSIRKAVAIAREKLELLVGIASLYRNPSELRLHRTALVTISGQDRIFEQTEQAFRRLNPRARARDDIAEAIRHFAKPEADPRVLSAIKQLALASSSSDTRTRFLNLWSSVETLAGAHEGGTVLEKVCELIVPLVTSRHVHRTTRYMTILTQRFSNRSGSTEFGPGFRLSHKGAIRTDDMLATLTAKCGDPKIAGLLKFAEHPLLRFRVFDTWSILHDPKKLRQRLIASETRLKWQVARIYRARNLLVHEGREVPDIVPLLDNLQNYLSTLVQRLVHETKRTRSKNWNVRHCIEYWNGRKLHALEGLDKSPWELTTRDFLEKGEHINLWQKS